jgi:hypothetical protein
VLSQPGQHVQARHDRHPHVQQHQVYRFGRIKGRLFQKAHRFLAVRHDLYVVAFLANEKIGQRLGDFRLVIHHQDARDSFVGGRRNVVQAAGRGRWQHNGSQLHLRLVTGC